MSSLREQILNAMKAALLGATPAADNVFRARAEGIPRDLVPAIGIAPETEEDTAFGDVDDHHEFLANVDIVVRGDPWESIADTVAVPAHKCLMTHPALSSLVTSIRKFSSTWQGQEADQTAGVLTMRYRIVYLTRASDIADANVM